MNIVPYTNLAEAVGLIANASKISGRNTQLSGDPHYQPEVLKPFMGYDQRVAWQILVEWFWMCALAKLDVMPKEASECLTKELLELLINKITTTNVTKVEREITNHDILALLHQMDGLLPEALKRWRHFGLTSYDVISTAYALSYHVAFERAIWPIAQEVDAIWREKIRGSAETRQIFRTHLQNALPGTIGCWLAVLHHRFISAMRGAREKVLLIPGKFSGAVGTSAALVARFGEDFQGEAAALSFLRLSKVASTQIPSPEAMLRFFSEMELVGGSLAQLGEDCRILAMSEIGEVVSIGSTSSTMSHKIRNPIAGENLAGMFWSLEGETFKARRALPVSNLQRDLRASNVMRGFGAIFTFTTQMLLTSKRLLSKMRVIEEACARNMARGGQVSTAELLHLSLQLDGLPDAHKTVNKAVVPRAIEQQCSLIEAMQGSEQGRMLLEKIPEKVRGVIADPTLYTGNAVRFALQEAERSL